MSPTIPADRPKRGEVWWVDFDPSIGGEIRKTRPAIIVSNDASNKALNRVQVIPVTSSVDRVYPSEAIVTFAGRQSKALADQTATISIKRLGERIGRLASQDMQAVERIIRLQLAL